MTRIGIPAELKDGEQRIALDPAAVASLVRDGHEVMIESGAGERAGAADGDYAAVGGLILPDAADVWAADLVVKVKEPQPSEYRHFRPDLQLFCYLHLAAEPGLTKALCEQGVSAYAFETLTIGGRLPLLAPMSEIAGRAAAIAAASLLSSANGGSGRMAGGAAGVAPVNALVIGLGVAGTMAARGLAGLDAVVTASDVDLQRLYDARTSGEVAASVTANSSALAPLLETTSVVIGAALVPGARAPQVLGKSDLSLLPPGSVVVDLAIDQGGCIEGSRPTSLSQPVFEEDGVLRYCVTNVPGQFPHTASRALSAAVAPHVRRLCMSPYGDELDGALNVHDKKIVHDTVAAA